METSFLFLRLSNGCPSQIGEGEAAFSKAWEITTANLYKAIIANPV